MAVAPIVVSAVADDVVVALAVLTLLIGAALLVTVAVAVVVVAVGDKSKLRNKETPMKKDKQMNASNLLHLVRVVFVGAFRPVLLFPGTCTRRCFESWASKPAIVCYRRP